MSEEDTEITTIKKIKVSVLRTEGMSALVEWYDDEADELKRAYVPRNEVSNGACSDTVLKNGIPYGLPWAKFLEVTMTPQDLQRELRRIGLWTLDDFATKGPQVFGAIHRASGINLPFLKKAALNYLKNKEG